MSLSDRVYRVLLWLYPRDFRDEYGREMSLLFRRARWGRWTEALGEVMGDLMFHAPLEHWRIFQQDLRYAAAVVAAQSRRACNCPDGADLRHGRECRHFQRGAYRAAAPVSSSRARPNRGRPRDPHRAGHRDVRGVPAELYFAGASAPNAGAGRV